MEASSSPSGKQEQKDSEGREKKEETNDQDSCCEEEAEESETHPPRNTHVFQTLSTRALGVAHPRWAEKQLAKTRPFIRSLTLQQKLRKHSGCVNTVAWSGDGDFLVSGSDDCDLNIWNHNDGLSLRHTIRTGHTGNIFCGKFVPHHGNRNVVSCAMDGNIRVSDVERGFTSLIANFPRRVHKLQFLPTASDIFLSAGSDGTVRYFDLRVDTAKRVHHSDVSNIVVDLRARSARDTIDINAIAVHPIHGHTLCVAGGDPYVRVYDLRMPFDFSSKTPAASRCVTKFVPPALAHSTGLMDDVHITGVAYNVKGTQIVATYSSDDIYVFDATESDIPLRLQHPEEGVRLTDGKDAHKARLAELKMVQDVLEEEEEEEEDDDCSESAEETARRRRRMLLMQMMGISCYGEDKSVNVQQSNLRKSEGTVKSPLDQRLTGHINVHTVKEVTFYGIDSEWVMSGSDKGRNQSGSIFVWDVKTGKTEMILRAADQFTVNCIATNPTDHITIATCGIDKDVKIWSPAGRKFDNYDKIAQQKLMRKNMENTGPGLSSGTETLRRLMNVLETYMSPDMSDDDDADTDDSDEEQDDEDDDEGEQFDPAAIEDPEVDAEALAEVEAAIAQGIVIPEDMEVAEGAENAGDDKEDEQEKEKEEEEGEVVEGSNEEATPIEKQIDKEIEAEIEKDMNDPGEVDAGEQVFVSTTRPAKPEGKPDGDGNQLVVEDMEE